MSKRHWTKIERRLAQLRYTMERETTGIPDIASAPAILKSRAAQLLASRARDARGWPLGRRSAAQLRKEIEQLVRFPPALQRDALLRSGVPRSDEPLVSIVIPIYGKLEFTTRCLLSLAHAHERAQFEVIVVDDGSPDESGEVLPRCPGLRYFRNEENVGFIESCNRGADAARGRYLHFLNNDTIVLPGFLDRLVEAMVQIPAAGLVGSRLIYPTLRLQESGGIVWRDGSATNFGNGQDPFNPSFTHLRDVDYCSAASVLIGRELFRELGGFDTRYKPAYYEDTDLAFKVRAAGNRVLVQPASRIIHFEGATSGTDVHVGPKKHQLTNRAVFADRWREVLDHHGTYGDIGPHERDRVSTSRVLVLDAKWPMPDRDSGSIDQINMLQILRNIGCAVTFVPALQLPRALGVPDILAPRAGYTEALEKIGIECASFPYETSVRRFLKERGGEFELVILTRARVADRFLPDVRRFCPDAKIVFNTTDLAYVREEREAAHKSSKLRAWVARDTKVRELGAVRGSDATIVLSTVEKEILEREVSGASIHVVPLIRDPKPLDAAVGTRSGVLFVGNFRHRPNLDAVEFLVSEVWPRVQAKLPDVRLHLVGNAAPPSVLSLASSHIEVHGFVPELEPVFRSMRVSIAPLRFGAGLKGKVAESLGFGVPCVSTSIGVEGSGLMHGEHVLVSDDAEGLAEAITALHRDDALWMRLSKNGYEFVRREYSLDANAARLEALFDALEVPRGHRIPVATRG